MILESPPKGVFAYDSGRVWTLCLAVTGEITGYYVLPVRSIFRIKECSEVVVSQKDAGINIEMIHVTTRVLLELDVNIP